MQKAFIEGFNGRMRDVCLNEILFLSLCDSHYELRGWGEDYNQIRLNSLLGNLLPVKIVKKTGQRRVIASRS